jgi:hypothetical protein
MLLKSLLQVIYGSIKNLLRKNCSETLETAEGLARKKTEREIGRYLKLAHLTINTIAFTLECTGELLLSEVTPSRKVATSLLNRLSNEIRAAALLVWNGYALQAASLVAALYEISITIAFIGGDDTQATKWINHDDPTTTPFSDLKTMTNKALTKLRVPDIQGQTAKEYMVYRQLCWAKHVNPILQKSHGVSVEGGVVAFFNGPDTSDSSIRASCYALETAAHLAYLALCSFVDNHLSHISVEARKGVVSRIEKIGAEKQALEALSIARWGAENPFPGRWRV